MTFRRLRDKHVHYNSVQFSCLVVSDSLRPHESQHARPPLSKCFLVPKEAFPNSGSQCSLERLEKSTRSEVTGLVAY